MADAKRDNNYVTSLIAVSNVDGITPVVLWADPTTHRLLVDLGGAGSGTVTDVSVVSANGFAGSVATSTTTPAITLSTTITGILKGNGTAISAATAGTDYVTATSTNTFTQKTYDTAGAGNAFSINGTAITAVTGTGAVVLAAAPTFTSSITVGVAAGTTGSILFKGTTSGTITLKSADAAGTYTLTLPTDDGNSGEVLSTNGSGVLSWVSAGGVPTTITVANEATDATCFVAFFTAATGDLGPKTNANMTFDSSTGIVTLASSVLTTTDINGGTIDGAVIGGASAAAITGTVITANTSILPDANDGAAIGAAATSFSDLFLASGALIGFANGDAVITHSAGVITVSTGDLRVTTAGTNSASAVTVGGTQTLTAKTLTAPRLASGGFIADANGNEGIILITTASAVNEITVTPAATGNAPKIAATGDDTNISLALDAKGTGKITPLKSVNFGALTAYFTETDNGNSSTADTIDWTLSNKQKSTLTGNCTFTFTAPPGPCNLILKLVQDGTGSRTVTWPAAVHWSAGTAPTLTTTASRVDIISFYYDGSTYFGQYGLNFVA